MKTIILVGDKTNRQLFLKDWKDKKSKAPNVYESQVSVGHGNEEINCINLHDEEKLPSILDSHQKTLAAIVFLPASNGKTSLLPEVLAQRKDLNIEFYFPDEADVESPSDFLSRVISTQIEDLKKAEIAGSTLPDGVKYKKLFAGTFLFVQNREMEINTFELKEFTPTQDRDKASIISRR